MEILYFHTDIGDFLDSLEQVTRAKVSRSIEVLAIDGYLLSMPYSKKVDDNLYELRVQSVQSVRIFYTFYGGKIVLLHAVFKKTQKLVKKDIEKAQKRLRYLRL
jgi:phage-related protein